jgi:hypothetical protein
VSRFDGARRGQIAVWTGAALAWGTAVTMAGQEPVQAGAETTEAPPSMTTETTVLIPLPALPDDGLVIIRYEPSVTVAPEVRTVYVQQSAPAVPRSSSPSPAPAAPAPRSGGS